ncbi:thioredoxin peroxidase [Oleiphilus sp. HI0009]|uniref:redoxin domain-containing protein n=1 Tax=Oleiphilus sp. HI0125 TaxID=1822266 RepID=UPI0007C34F4F|nr:redoxin domain-containing protein [Oleiphilus sp. HI0125]KZX83157.1 thioredoxin peroxidase [Oleiphilus sp. HI0009]KZZ57075.1 thioredoxin peroxidase [Oleiphilus sp. HI0125]KZZ59262.1 thioredoxin peroxidase [Oleiphilus sp. HI0125]
MSTYKFEAGATFPSITKSTLEGTTRDLSKPLEGKDWQMLVVYRGRHCPLCTRFLNQLTVYKPRLEAINIDLVAVSGDSKAQLKEHTSRLDVDFPMFYGLSLEEMKSLGLYISHPRSDQETDHPFAEPGLYVINEHGTLQVVDISNNPFVRPDLDNLISGLEWIRSNNYPIRGTFSYDN